MMSDFVLLRSNFVNFLPNCSSSLAISRSDKNSNLSFSMLFFVASSLAILLASIPILASCSRNLDNPNWVLACISAFVRFAGLIISKNGPEMTVGSFAGITLDGFASKNNGAFLIAIIGSSMIFPLSLICFSVSSLVFLISPLFRLLPSCASSLAISVSTSNWFL